LRWIKVYHILLDKKRWLCYYPPTMARGGPDQTGGIPNRPGAPEGRAYPAARRRQRRASIDKAAAVLKLYDLAQRAKAAGWKIVAVGEISSRRGQTRPLGTLDFKDRDNLTALATAEAAAVAAEAEKAAAKKSQPQSI
jgi:hypothetical protein